nr:MAG TPA: hypothetical protein [Bacteriophage sp.]
MVEMAVVISNNALLITICYLFVSYRPGFYPFNIVFYFFQLNRQRKNIGINRGFLIFFYFFQKKS